MSQKFVVGGTDLEFDGWSGNIIRSQIVSRDESRPFSPFQVEVHTGSRAGVSRLSMTLLTTDSLAPGIKASWYSSVGSSGILHIQEGSTDLESLQQLGAYLKNVINISDNRIVSGKDVGGTPANTRLVIVADFIIR